MLSTRFSRIALLPMLLLSTRGFAQDGSQAREYGPWVWGLQGGAVEQFEAGLAGDSGEFSVSRSYIEPSLSYAWDRQTSLSLSLGYGRSDYDFSSDASIEDLPPWERIEDYRVSMPVRFAPTDRSKVIVIPSVRSYVEEGTSLGDGLTAGVLAGASWRFSDRLELGPGFGWFSELGGGSNAFPILLVDWELADGLSLTTGRGIAASQGPGLSLEYALDSKWKMALSGRYEKTRFALNGEGSAEGGFGEERSLPLLLSVEYSPWPMTSVSAVLGAEFEGSLRLEDGNGSRIAESRYDTAPVLGLVFSSRF